MTRVLVHLSDLHFGREDPHVVAALLAELRGISPDVVAISGDLTQRARRHQFRKARAFLDALPFPQVVVPGNHDVPLYNLFARLFDPLGGYRRVITTDLQPVWSDRDLVVVGLDTTRPTTLKDSRISQADISRLAAVLADAPPHAAKIFVGHHPFDAPDEGRRDALDTVVLGALTRIGIDVFLTGHLHISYAGHTAHRYQIGGRSAIVVEAGTATSTRLRDESNAFNLLRIEADAITVECHAWDGARFAIADTQRFVRTADGWRGEE